MNKIVAHRGWPSRAPENTMSSIELALKDAKVDMIEIDVQLTKDEEIVVIHDFNIDRTSNGKGYIKELEYKELKRLDFGSWFSKDYKNERIPRLEEVLSLIRDKKELVIEIKDISGENKILDRLYDILKEFKYIDNIYVKSFNHELIRSFKQYDNNLIKTGLLFVGLPTLIPEQIKFTNCSFISIQYQSINPKLIRDLKANSIDIMAWTVDNREDIQKIKSLSNDIAIITNYPDRSF